MDVLIAFGSYGTVIQTLSLGVPMVVVSNSEDKPEVAAGVTWMRTGIDLATDTPKPEQIRDAVDQILAKTEYRARAQKLAREFASYDSAKKANGVGRGAGCPAGGARRLTQIFANWGASSLMWMSRQMITPQDEK